MPILGVPTLIGDLAPYIQSSTDAYAPCLWMTNSEGGNTLGTGAVSSAHAQVSIKVNWADRWTAMGVISGATYPTIYGFAYKIPLQYPEQPYLYADSYEVRPIGTGPNSSIPYKYAIIDIHFATPQFSYDGDDAFLTVQSNVSGNFVTIPDYTYAFADGTATKQDVGILVPEETITVTRHRCTEINRPAFISVVGQLNNDVFFGWAEGCVMVTGIESNVQYTQYGTPMYDVTYSFSCKTVGWNYFLHPSGSFLPVFNGAGGTPYSETDITACYDY